MILGIVVLLTALAISAVAAWYSIVGLTAIFSAESAFWSIVIMGAVLELGKLVLASALYQHWDDLNRLWKIYLVPALACLMLITSMGVFGYLSRAHLEHANGNIVVSSKLNQLDSKLTFAKAKEKQITNNITSIYDQATKRSLSGYVTLADKTIRKLKKKGSILDQYNNDLKSIQQEINFLQAEQLELQTEVDKVKAEVGPIRYVAEYIFGAEASKSEATIDRAVRYVISLLVLVLDPLAVCLIIVANYILGGTWQGRVLERERQNLYKGGRPKGSRNKKTVLRSQNTLQEFMERNEPETVPATLIRKKDDNGG